MHAPKPLVQFSHAMSKTPQTFSFRVALSPDALWAHLCARDDVRASSARAPDPAPPFGAPFLASREHDQTFRLRRWSGSADAPSPVVMLQVLPDGEYWRVEGKLAKSPTKLPWVFATVMLVGVFAAVATLGAPVMWWFALLMGVPLIVIGLPIWWLSHRWNRRSNAVQTESLRGFVGQVFSPLALPESETPFR